MMHIKKITLMNYGKTSRELPVTTRTQLFGGWLHGDNLLAIKVFL